MALNPQRNVRVTDGSPQSPNLNRHHPGPWELSTDRHVPHFHGNHLQVIAQISTRELNTTLASCCQNRETCPLAPSAKLECGISCVCTTVVQSGQNLSWCCGRC